MSRNKEKQHLLNALLGKGVNTWKFFNEDINLQEAKYPRPVIPCRNKSAPRCSNIYGTFGSFEHKEKQKIGKSDVV